jgi:hypothetical protein
MGVGLTRFEMQRLAHATRYLMKEFVAWDLCV